MSRRASGSLLSAIGIEFLVQSFDGSFPGFQRFGMFAGQSHPTAEFRLLFRGQISGLFSGRQRLHLLFEFQHAHGRKLAA